MDEPQQLKCVFSGPLAESHAFCRNDSRSQVWQSLNAHLWNVTSRLRHELLLDDQVEKLLSRWQKCVAAYRVNSISY